MTCDSAEHPCVRIVHLPLYRVATPEGGRHSLMLGLGAQIVGRLRQLKWIEDLSRNEALQRHSRRALEQEPEENGIEITVDGLLTGRTYQRLRVQNRDRGVTGLRLPEEWHVRAQATRVVQEHSHGDIVFGSAGKPR